MRVWFCLVAAGVLLSGCTNSALFGGGLGEKEVTSGTAPPASGRPPTNPRYVNSNDNCVTAWEQNAYHYQCDPNANY
jgi:hypothetical protein